MPYRDPFDIGDVLHIYNRGVDKRIAFEEGWDYVRFVDLLDFCRKYNYQFSEYKSRLKQAQDAEAEEKVPLAMETFHRYPKPLCEIVAWTLMPNHFHLILVETLERGISRFMQKISNSYTKYFNAKNERSGSLFQGVFKHVEVKSEEQLFHLSRYVHINPTAAGLVDIFGLKDYPWSSFSEYLSEDEDGTKLCGAKDLVLAHFRSKQTYFNFVTAEFREDEAALKLEGLTLDDDFDWYDTVI